MANTKDAGKKAKRIVNSVVRALQKDTFQSETEIEVTEVFKGGSMGQGTTVPGQYDIDLVLYSRSFKVDEVVEEGYVEELKDIDTYLKQTFGDNYTSLAVPEDGDITKVAIKFRYNLPGGYKLDVDLLLSPYWSDRHELFRSLRDVRPPIKRLMFSASCSKWQTEFIKQQPQHVRELIRRAKAWRNRTWMMNTGGRPKSYLISLLVITAYMRVDPQIRGRRRLKTVAPSVTEKLKTLVKNIRGDKNLDLSIPGADVSLKHTYADLLPECPRIIDPVNPANNVYLSGIGPSPYGPGDGRWDIFASRIGSINLNVCVL